VRDREARTKWKEGQESQGAGDLMDEATGVFVASHWIIEPCHCQDTLHKELRKEGEMLRKGGGEEGSDVWRRELFGELWEGY
jgi:hypothetical protein